MFQKKSATPTTKKVKAKALAAALRAKKVGGKSHDMQGANEELVEGDSEKSYGDPSVGRY